MSQFCKGDSTLRNLIRWLIQIPLVIKKKGLLRLSLPEIWLDRQELVKVVCAWSRNSPEYYSCFFLWFEVKWSVVFWQMSAYFAPAFFSHLLGRCLRRRNPFLEVSKLALIVMGTFALVWWPYLHSKEAFLEVWNTKLSHFFLLNTYWCITVFAY